MVEFCQNFISFQLLTLTTQNVTWSNIISACSSLYVYRDQHAHLYFTRSADTLPLSNRFNRRPLWRFGDGVHHVAITRPIKSNTRRGVRHLHRSSPFIFYSILIRTYREIRFPSVLSYWMIGGIVALGIWGKHNYDCNFIDLMHFRISFSLLFEVALYYFWIINNREVKLFLRPYFCT